MSSQTTILVPTDFRVASLNTLWQALEQIDQPTVDVVLLYCQGLDNSITELLFYSPERILRDLVTADFRDALSILIHRFETKIGRVQFELFHGHVQSVFDTLLDTLNVDAIYISKSYRLLLTKRAFDPLSYIRKSKLPCYELGGERPTSVPQVDKLENLFLQ